MDKMKAAVFTEPGNIELMEIEKPQVGDRQVLIKIKYCGICGTDMHIYNGVYSKDKLPLVAGHEFSGVIEQVGKEVKAFEIGQRVTGDINLTCGMCFYCRKNQPFMCQEMQQLGIHMDGAFAQYIVLPEDKVFQIPNKMSFEEAALLEPISCVVRSAKSYNVKIGESITIIGDGATALLHVQMAKISGASPIIVIGLDENRMKKAKELGADYVLKSSTSNIEQVKELTDGRGADVVIESVGLKVTYEQAFNLVRPGGKIVAFGLSDDSCKIEVKPLDFILKELTMIGSVAGAKNDLADAISLVQHNRFSLDDYKNNIVPLADISSAFERLKTDRSILKILIKIDD
jgi:2-desacetyl-2-hydroxyethyl bacteriochlorophyllide A dehydrogenase